MLQSSTLLDSTAPSAEGSSAAGHSVHTCTHRRPMRLPPPGFCGQIGQIPALLCVSWHQEQEKEDQPVTRVSNTRSVTLSPDLARVCRESPRYLSSPSLPLLPPPTPPKCLPNGNSNQLLRMRLSHVPPPRVSLYHSPRTLANQSPQFRMNPTSSTSSASVAATRLVAPATSSSTKEKP